MFENIEPSFFKILPLTIRESSSGEKKGKKCKQNEILSKLFPKFEDLKRIPAFCVRSSMFEQKSYKNSFKSYLTRNLRRKWAKTVYVECDTDAKFKDDFSQFFLLLCAASSWEPNFGMCIFSSILILFTFIYCIGYRVKNSVFEVFKLLVCFHTKWGKFRFLVVGSSMQGLIRFLVCDI
jgi:hypothetical protein